MNRKITLEKIILYFLFLFMGISVVFKAFTLNPDNDMWWMMATGRYIWENATVPVINPFVIHEDFAIIVQQWLLAVVNYLLYDRFGAVGLVVFAILIFTVNAFLIYRLTAHFASSRNIRATVLIIGMFLCTLYLNTRPTQFTISILLLEQLVVLNWKKSKKIRWLWALPILSLAQMNIHAALWPIFFVMLLPYIVPNVFAKKDVVLGHLKEVIVFVEPLLISFAVGFLNPNGANGVFYLIKSYNSSDLFQAIQEVRSPAVFSSGGFLVVIAVVVLVLRLFLYKDKDFYKVYMLAGVIILSSMHLRNLWMLLFGLIPVLCEMLQDYFPKQGLETTTAMLICYTSVFACLLVAVVFFCVTNIADAEHTLPERAADYLDAKDTQIVLYTGFNTGGYMEWRGYKVYMDARPELFQKRINGKEDVADEFFDVECGYIDYDAFVEKYGFTHILIEKNKCFDIYLRYSSEYVPVSEDGNYVLYEQNM